MPSIAFTEPDMNYHDSSDDSIRRLTDDFGRHRLTDLMEMDEGEENDLDYLRRSPRRNRYSSIGSTASSIDGLWELHPRRLSEAGLSRHSDSSAVLTEDTDSFMIGQRVWVGGTKPGTIAYIGETQFAPGDWAGIALDEPIGKNDGSVAGTRYFQCENKKGVFSRLTRLTREPLDLPSTPERHTPSNNGVRRSPISPTGSTRSLLKSPASLSNSNTSLHSSATHVDFKIGDRVIIKSTQGSKVGTVRYMGLTDFAPGEWVGVELDDPRGKNDGSVEGKRYFECRPNFGLFAPISKVSKSPSKVKPSACLVHSGPGLPPSGIKRANSRESMTSIASKTSAASSVRRVRLGVTSLTPKRVPPKTATPIPTRTALQDVLREKQQHIEQLLKERDLERTEVTRAASQADEAEQKFYALKHEFEQYRSECEQKVREDKEVLEKLKVSRDEVLSQLEDEKRKNEDLQFRFEEAAITKSDIEENILAQSVTSEGYVTEIKELQQKLDEERQKSEHLETTSNKLFEAEEALIKAREETETLRSELVAARQLNEENVENQLRIYTEENQKKQSTIDQLTTEVTITKREIAENCQQKDEQLDHQKKLLEKYEKTHLDLAKENDKLKMELSAKTHDLEVANEKISAKDNEIKALRDDLESVKKEMTLKIDDLERHKTNQVEVEENLRKELEQQREKLKSKISEVENVKKECNVQVNQKDQQIVDANKIVTEKTEEIVKLNKELDAVKTSFEETKNEIHGRHARQVASQDSQLMALSAEIQEKNEEVTKLSIVVSKLEEDLCTKNGVIEKLRLELETYQNQQSDHTEASTALNQKLNELTLSNGDLYRQLTHANDRINDLLEVKQRLEGDVQALTARCDNDGQLEQLRVTIQQKESLLEGMKAEFQEKLQTTERLRHEAELQRQQAVNSFEQIKSDLEAKLHLSTQSEELLKQRCEGSLAELTKLRDEYRMKITELEHALQNKDLAVTNLQNQCSETVRQYQEQMKTAMEEMNRKLQDFQQRISTMNEESVKLKEELSKKSEEIIELRAESSHIVAQSQNAETELKQKFSEDTKQLQFELNEKKMQLEKALTELQLLKNDCHNTNADLTSKDEKISELSAQVKNAQQLINQLQEELSVTKVNQQHTTNEHQMVHNQCKDLLDQVASLTQQVTNGEAVFKNLEIEHKNAMQLIDRLRITEQQKQQCLQQLQADGDKNCDNVMRLLDQVKTDNSTQHIDKILQLQKDVELVRNQLAERNHQFDAQQNELLRLQQELLKAQQANAQCLGGTQDHDSVSVNNTPNTQYKTLHVPQSSNPLELQVQLTMLKNSYAQLSSRFDSLRKENSVYLARLQSALNNGNSDVIKDVLYSLQQANQQYRTFKNTMQADGYSLQKVIQYSMLQLQDKERIVSDQIVEIRNLQQIIRGLPMQCKAFAVVKDNGVANNECSGLFVDYKKVTALLHTKQEEVQALRNQISSLLTECSYQKSQNNVCVQQPCVCKETKQKVQVVTPPPKVVRVMVPVLQPKVVVKEVTVPVVNGMRCPPPRIEKIEVPRVIIQKVPFEVKVPPQCTLPDLSSLYNCNSWEQELDTLTLINYSPVEIFKFKQTLLSLVTRQKNCAQSGTCPKLPLLKPVESCISPIDIINSVNIEGYNPSNIELYKQSLLQILTKFKECNKCTELRLPLLQVPEVCVSPSQYVQNLVMQGYDINDVTIFKKSLVDLFNKFKVCESHLSRPPLESQNLYKQIPVCGLPQLPSIHDCIAPAEIMSQINLNAFPQLQANSFKKTLLELLLLQQKCSNIPSKAPRILVKSVPVSQPGSTQVPVSAHCRLPNINVFDCSSPSKAIEFLNLAGYNPTEASQFKQSILSLINTQRNCKGNLANLSQLQGNPDIVNPIAVPSQRCPPKILAKQVPVSVTPTNNVIIKDRPVPIQLPPRIITKEVPVRVPVQIVEIPKVIVKEVKVPVRVMQPPRIIVKEVPIRIPQPPKIIVKQVPVVINKTMTKPVIIYKDRPVFVQSSPRIITKEVPVKIKVPGVCHLPEINIGGCGELQNQIENLVAPNYCPLEFQAFKQKLLSILSEQRRCATPKVIVKQVPIPVPQPPKIIHKQVPIVISDCKPRIIIKEKPIQIQSPPRTIVKEVPVKVPVSVPTRCYLPNLKVQGCDNLQRQIEDVDLSGYESSVASNFKQILLSLLLEQRKCTQMVPTNFSCHLPRILIRNCDDVLNPLTLSGYDNSEAEQFKQDLLTAFNLQKTCVQCKLPEINVMGCRGLQHQIQSLSLPNYNTLEVQTFKQNLLSMLLEQRKCVQTSDGPTRGIDFKSGNVPVKQIVEVPKVVIKEVRIPVRVEVPKIITKQVQVPVPQPPKVIIKQVPVMMKCDHKPQIIVKEKPVPIQAPPRTITKEVPVPVRVPIRSDCQIKTSTCKLPSLHISGCDALQNQIEMLNLPGYGSLDVQNYKQNLLTLLLDQRKCVRQLEGQTKEIRIPEEPKVVVKEVRVPVRVPVLQPPKIITKQVRVPVLQPPKVIIKQVPVMMKCDHKPKIIIKQVPVRVPGPSPPPVKMECHLPNIDINTCENIENDIASIALDDYSATEVVAFKQKLLSSFMSQRNCVQCKLPQVNVMECEALHNQIESLNMPNYKSGDVQVFKQNLLNMLLYQRKCVQKCVPKEVVKEVRVPVPQPPKVLVKQIPVPVPQPPKIIIRQVPVMMKCDHKQKIVVKEKPVPVQVPPRTITKEVPVRIKVPVRVSCRLPSFSVTGCDALQNQIGLLNLPNYSPVDAQNFKRNLLTMLLDQRKCAEQPVPKVVVKEVRLPPKILVKQVTVPVPQPPKIIVKQVPIIISKCSQKPRIIVKEKPVPVQMPPRTIIKEVPVKIPVPVRNECHLPALNINCENIQSQIASLDIWGYNSMEIQRFKQNLMSTLLNQRQCTQPIKDAFKMLPVRGNCQPKVVVKQVPVPVPQPPKVIIKQVPVMMKCDHKPKIIVKEKPVQVPVPRIVIKEVPVRVPVKPECHLPDIKLGTCINSQSQIDSLQISGYDSLEVANFKQKLFAMITQQRNCISQSPNCPTCRLPELHIQGCEQINNQISALAVTTANPEDVLRFRQNLLTLILQQRNCQAKDKPVYIRVPFIKEVKIPVPQPPKIIVKQVPVPVPCDHKPKIIIKEKPVLIKVPPRTITKEVPVNINVPVPCRLPSLSITGCDALQNQVEMLNLPNYRALDVQNFKQSLLTMLLDQRKCVKPPEVKVPARIPVPGPPPPPIKEITCKLPQVNIVECEEIQNRIASLILPNYNSEDVQIFKQNLLNMLLHQRTCVKQPKEIVKEVKVPVKVFVPQPPKILVKQVPVPVPQPPKIIIKQVPVMMKCDHKPQIIVKEKPVLIQAPPRTITKEVPVPVRVPIRSDCQIKTPTCKLPSLHISSCDALQSQIEMLNLPGYNSLDVQNYKQNLLTMLLDQRKCVRQLEGQSKEIRIPEEPKVVVKEVRVPVPQPPRVIIKQVPVMMKCDHKPKIIIKQVPVRVPGPSPPPIIKEVKVPVKMECHLPNIDINTCENIENGIASIVLDDYSATEVVAFKQKLLSSFTSQRNCVQCKLPQINVMECEALHNQIESLNIPNYKSGDVQIFKQNLLNMLLYQRKCVKQSDSVETCVPKEVVSQPPKVIVKQVPVVNNKTMAKPTIIYKDRPVFVQSPPRTITKEVPVKIKVPGVCHLPDINIGGCGELQNQIENLVAPNYSHLELQAFKQKLLSILSEQRRCATPKVIVKQVPIPVPQPPKIIHKQVPIVVSDCKPRIIIKEKPIQIQSPPRTIVKEVPVKVPVSVPTRCYLPNLKVQGCDNLQRQIEEADLTGYESSVASNFKQILLSLLLEQRKCTQMVPTNFSCHLPRILIRNCDDVLNPLTLSGYDSSEAEQFKQDLLTAFNLQKTCIQCKLPEINVMGCRGLQHQIQSLSLPNYNTLEVHTFKQNLLSMLLEQRKCVQTSDGPTRGIDFKSGNVPVRIPVKQIVEVPKVVIKEVRIPVRVEVPKIITKQVQVPVPQPPKVIIKQVPVMMKCDHKPQIIVKEKPVPIQAPPRTITKEVPVPVRVPIRSDCQIKTPTCKLPSLHVSGCDALQNQIEMLNLPGYNFLDVQNYKQNLLTMLLDQRKCVRQSECQSKEISIPVKQNVEVPKVVVKEVRVPVRVPVLQPPKIITKQVRVPVLQPPKVIIKQVPVMMKCDHKPKIIIKQVPVRVPGPSPPPVRMECHLPNIDINTCENIENDIASVVLDDYSATEVVAFKQKLLSSFMSQRNCVQCKLPQVNVMECEALHNQIESLNIPNYKSGDVQVFKQNLLNMLLYQRKCVEKCVPKEVVKEIKVPVPQPSKVLVKQIPVPVPQPPKIIIKQVPVMMKCDHKQKIIVKEKPVPVQVPPRTITKEVPVRIKVPVRVSCKLPSFSVTGCDALQNQISLLNLPNYSHVDAQNFKQNLLTMLLDQRKCAEVRLPPKILVKQVTVPVPQPPKIIVKQVPIIISKCSQKPRIIVKEKPVPVQMPPRTIIKEVPVKIPVPVRNECHLPALNINCENIQSQIASLDIWGYNSMEIQRFKQNLMSTLLNQRQCTQPIKDAFKMLPVQGNCQPKVVVKQVPVPVPQPPKVIIKQVPVMMKCDHKPKIIVKEKPVQVPVPRIVIKEVPVRVPVKPECHLPDIKLGTCINSQSQIDSLQISGYDSLEVANFKQKLFAMITQQRNCISQSPNCPTCRLPELHIQGCEQINNQISALAVTTANPEDVLRFRQNLLTLILQQRNCQAKDKPVYIRVPFIKEVKIPVPQPPKIIVKQVPVPVPCDHKPKIIIKEKPVLIKVPPRTITKEVPVNINVPVPCRLPSLSITGCDALQNQVEMLNLPNYRALDVQNFKQSLLTMLLDQRKCVKPPEVKVPIRIPVPGPPPPPVKEIPCKLPQVNIVECEEIQNRIASLILPNYNSEDVQIFKQNLLNMLLHQRTCVKQPKEIVKEVKVPVKVFVPQPPKILIKQVPVPVPQPPKVIIKQVPVMMKCDHKPQIIVKEKPVPIQAPPRTITKEVPVPVRVPIRLDSQIKTPTCKLPSLHISSCDALQNQIEMLNLPGYNSLDVQNYKQNLLTMLLDQRKCVRQLEGQTKEIRIPEEPKVVVKEVRVPVPQPPRVIIKQVPVMMKCDHKPKIIIKQVPVPVPGPSPPPVKMECHLPNIDINTCGNIENGIASIALDDYSATEVVAFKRKLLSSFMSQRNCVQCKLPQVNVMECEALHNQIESLNMPNYKSGDVQVFKQNLLNMLLYQRKCVQKCVPKEVVKEVRVPVPQPPKVLVKQIPVPVPQPPKIVIKQVPVMMKCDHRQKIVVKEKPVPVQVPPRTITKEVPVRIKVPVWVSCRLPSFSVTGCDAIQNQIGLLNLPNYSPVDAQIFKQNLLTMLLDQRKCAEQPVPKVVVKEVRLPPKILVKQVTVPVPQPPKIIVKQVPIIISKCSQKPRIIVKEKPVPVQMPPRTIIKEVPVKIPVPVRNECHLPALNINCENIQNQIASLDIWGYNSMEVQRFKQNLMSTLLNQRQCTQPIKDAFKMLPVRGNCQPKVVVKQVPVPVPQPPKVIIKQVPVMMKCDHKQKIIVKEKPIPVPVPRIVTKEVPVKTECHLPEINLGSCVNSQSQIESLQIPDYSSWEVARFKQNLFTILTQQKTCGSNCHLPNLNIQGCTELENQVGALVIPNGNPEEMQSFKQNLLSILLQQRNCQNKQVPSPPKVIVKQVPVPVPQPPRVIVKQVPVMMKCDHKQKVVVKEVPVRVPGPSPPPIVKEIPVPVKVNVPIRVPVKAECHLPDINFNTCENIENKVASLLLEGYSSVEVTNFKQKLLASFMSQRNCMKCKLPQVNIMECDEEMQNQVASLKLPNYGSEDVQIFKQNLLNMLLHQRRCVKQPTPQTCIPKEVNVPPKVLVRQVPVPVPQPPKVIIKQVPVMMKCDHKQKVIIKEKPIRVPVLRVVTKEVPVTVRIPIKQECHLPKINLDSCINAQSQVDVLQIPGYSPLEVMKFKQNLFTILSHQKDCVSRCRLPEINVRGCSQLEDQIDALVVPNVGPQDVQSFKRNLLSLLLEQQNCQVKTPKIIVKQIPVPVKCDDKKPNIIIQEKPVYLPSRSIVKCHLPDLSINGCTGLENQVEALTLHNYDSTEVSTFKQKLLSLLTQQTNCANNMMKLSPTQCHLPRITIAGCEDLEKQIESVSIHNFSPVETNAFKHNLIAMLLEQRKCTQKCEPKTVRVLVPQPPKVIVKQVPVYMRPESQTKVKQVPPRVIVRVVQVPKIVIQQVPIPQPPKIVEKQIPVRIQLPPKVIIKEVKVPVVEGKVCPPPKVIVEKVSVPQPPRIITKPVLVHDKVPPKVLFKQVSVPCALPVIPTTNVCDSPENLTSRISLGTNNLNVFKNNLVQLLRQQRLCNQPKLPSSPSCCEAIKQKFMKRARYYGSQLCRYRKIFEQLRTRFGNSTSVGFRQGKRLPAVPLPMLHVMKSVTPSIPMSPFQRASSSVMATSESFVRNLHQAYKNTQTALQHCMDAILAQKLTHSQINAKCKNCQQLIQDKEMAENQIRFLNSIIVDIQKKNEEQKARIEILESGCSVAMADELKLIGSSERQFPPRMYCDICEEFDLHETEDCPQQNTDVVPANGQRGHKHAEDRPYCEICEKFGHATEDCKEDQTF